MCARNSRFCAGPSPGDYNSMIHQGMVLTESCLRIRVDYQCHLKPQPTNKTYSITLSIVINVEIRTCIYTLRL
jgi:hypothetical protein